METIFRKVSPENNWNEASVVIGCYGGDMLTLKCIRYGDRDQLLGFIDLESNRYHLLEIDWTLKEIEIPADPIIQPSRRGAPPTKEYCEGYIQGANLILNKLKS